MTDQPYQQNAPDLTELQAEQGPLLLVFGTPWCGHCRAAEPLLDDILREFPRLRQLKIEDGRGKRLGRQFGVKLWPTLILLRDGEEQARVVRPTDRAALAPLLSAL
ncbi:thioredoxin family protein [Alkalilimnicola sp. S0819]|uniref:thioredoxin family protein n=1 Tax=Alkalilimnicola sp. S0819 TaxID=2613922 RepID=UPI0012625DE7|nr:thioredoxin family protein [Alkalilimnicola sp. S0819]KAB7624376.1 thioredoxin family protein [Alkalilimnicola sp. S0819]MPQ16202.1 thioredoxin [Alkalilimnicola sp. S0819]